MENPKDMLMTVISDAELERRWRAARDVMLEHKIDYLIMRNNETNLAPLQLELDCDSLPQ